MKSLQLLFLTLFYVFSAFASPPSLVPSTPGQEKILGKNHYGSETIETVQSFGLVRLNGTTITESLQVNGSLIANHAQINHLDVLGEAHLTDTIVKGGGNIIGYFQAHKSTIETPLVLTSQRAIFTGCKLQGITIRQGDGFKGKQVLELKQKTVVNGPIVFESGKGEVHLYSGSKIFGAITGGKVIKKS